MVAASVMESVILTSSQRQTFFIPNSSAEVIDYHKPLRLSILLPQCCLFALVLLVLIPLVCHIFPGLYLLKKDSQIS